MTDLIERFEVHDENRLPLCDDRHSKVVVQRNLVGDRSLPVNLRVAKRVPVRVPMDSLGHTDIATRQNIYTHAFDEAEHQTTDAMDKLVGGGQDNEQQKGPALLPVLSF